jgi:hypothetical protein
MRISCFFIPDDASDSDLSKAHLPTQCQILHALRHPGWRSGIKAQHVTFGDTPEAAHASPFDIRGRAGHAATSQAQNRM